MKNRSLCRRLICLVLALVMALPLAGCGGGDGRRPTDAPEAGGEDVIIDGEQVRETVSKEDADKYMHNDATISSHIAHSKALNPQADPGRTAEEFHIYVSNTETMLGFVNGKRVTAYQEGVQSAFDAATKYKVQYGHSLKRQGATGLYWGEAQKMDDLFMRDVLSAEFYKGNVLPMDGTLAPLFRDGATPFGENSLTLLVSNFVEPGFELNALASGIEDYFDSYTKSAACVIGFTSQFEGRFHIPNYNSPDRSTFFIQNFSGEVPYYMVVVGPEGDVEEYTEMLFQYLDNSKVDYSYEHYSNSVYEEVFAQPLVFDLIPDRKAQKMALPVLSSYNTGTLTEHAEGGAFFTTYSSVETRDVGSNRGKESSSGDEEVKVSKSSQISLISRNYDGESLYDFDYSIYVYDKDTKQWKDAGKNAMTKVAVTMEPVSGQLTETVVDKTYVVLENGREEMYVSVQLDFGTEDILSRDEIYRLEMRVHLNQQTSDGKNGANGSGLSSLSTTSTKYFAKMDELTIYSQDGDYIWSGTNGSIRSEIAPVLERTPNLEALLISLSELENKYQKHTEMYSYLDFVFNIRDKSSKRR